MTMDQVKIKGCSNLKRPAQEAVKPPPRPKRSNNLPQTEKRKAKKPHDARVYLGVAFARWRELRETDGLKSDVEVALKLLDGMKNMSSSPAASAASDEKIKVSKSEVQRLIEQEVHSAVKMKETRVDDLLQTIQRMDYGVDYESSLQKLEARIMMVTKRGEALLAYMKKDPLASLHVAEISRTKSEEDTKKTVSQSKSPTNSSSMAFMEQSRELSEMMETTTKAVKKMRADNIALKAAIAGLTTDPLPPGFTPCDISQSKVLHRPVKKEPDDDLQEENTIKKVEPQKVPKVEPVSLGYHQEHRSSPTHIDSVKRELSYPPLPPTTVPCLLKMEAASFNIPQRPTVQLALIKKPACLSILWTVEKEDPLAPPMDSYSVFITVENVKGSGVFPDWKTPDEVKAQPLPMYKTISKYEPGHKVCVAVVGKDKFGRYGPYSKVVIATIPELEVAAPQ